MQPLVKAAFLALAVCSCKSVMKEELPPIPDSAYAKGVSAPFCGLLGNDPVIAGGANFPGKSLLEGGEKKVYNNVWRLSDGRWSQIATLPDSTAYGASFQLDEAILFAGGNVNGISSDRVFILDKDGLRELPSLPVPIEQAGSSRCGEELFLCGGGGVYSCRIGEWRWTLAAPLPMPLVQPVAFASPDALYLWGGFNPESLEVPSCGWKLQKGKTAWEPCAGIPDGGSFVGASGVSLPDGRLAVVGGVNRDIFAKALHNGPEDRIPYLSMAPEEYRFRSSIFVFNPKDEFWTEAARAQEFALAGPGVAAAPDGSLYIAGGELKPGVRSPKILRVCLKK